MKIAAIIILLVVGISTAYATSNMLLLHVGSGGSGGGSVTPDCILVDTGNQLLADTGNCILVQ